MECNKPPFRVSTTNTDQTRRKCNNNNNQPTTHNRLTTNGNYNDCEVQRVQKINMRFFTLLQTSSHCRCSYPMCYICSFSSRCRIVSLNIFWQAENHVILFIHKSSFTKTVLWQRCHLCTPSRLVDM